MTPLHNLNFQENTVPSMFNFKYTYDYIFWIMQGGKIYSGMYRLQVKKKIVHEVFRFLWIRNG